MSKLALIWSAVTAGGAAATAGVLVATGVIDIDKLTGRQVTTPAPLVSQQGEAKPTKTAPETTVARAPDAAEPAKTPAEKAPSFDIVRVEPTGDAVVAGESEPGAIVALLSNGKVVGKTVADQSGAWTIVLEKPLEPGDHDLSAASMDGNDKTRVESEERVAVSVPKDKDEELLVVMNKPGEAVKVLQKPAAKELKVAEAPQTTEPAETKPEAETVVAVAEPEKPAEPAAEATPETPAEESPTASAPTPAEKPAVPTITLKPAEPAKTETATAPEPEKPAIAAMVTLEAVETENGKLFVAGAATPGSEVRVYIEDTHVGTAKADASGRWLLETTRELSIGKHTVRADQIGDAKGAVLARAEVPFERDAEAVVLTPLEVAAKGGSGDAGGTVTLRKVPSVIIRKGDNLWRISRRQYGMGVRYTTIYTANKKQIRNPHRIYPGQVFRMPEGDVNWGTN